jgi:hypothetical protein
LQFKKAIPLRAPSLRLRRRSASFGSHFGAALGTLVGVLIEAPVMLLTAKSAP